MEVSPDKLNLPTIYQNVYNSRNEAMVEMRSDLSGVFGQKKKSVQTNNGGYYSQFSLYNSKTKMPDCNRSSNNI